jgi:dTDP-D-glucose 4,6-dehydratase
MEPMWIKVKDQDKFINSKFMVSIEERNGIIYIKMIDGLKYQSNDERLHEICNTIRSEYESNNR